MIQRLGADRRWLLATCALVAIYYAGLLPIVTDRLDPLTGDEPFYVMTAISIIRDGDLNEANNYAQRDYDEFYPGTPLPAGWNGWPAFPRTLPPHPATTELPGLHTKHALGLSLLIAVPYAMAGRSAAALVVLLCGVLLAGQMYLLGRTTGAMPDIAGVGAVGLAIVMPIAPYGLLIFPEIPAALLLLYAIRRLAASQNAGWQWTLAGAAIGFLPWLHQRFVPTAVILAGVLLYRVLRGRQFRSAALGVGLTSIGGVLLLVYNLWLYRSPFQSTNDHAGFNGPTGTLNGSFGLLLDAQWGLLIVAPIYLLVLAALPFWVRASRWTAVLAMAAVLPYLAVVAAYRVWWGEWGPAARYLVPIAPLAAAPLCAWLARSRIVTRVAIAMIWAVGLVITSVGFADPQRFYHQPNGVNRLTSVIDDRLGTHISASLVAFQPYALSPRNERIGASLLLLALFGILVMLMYLIPGLRATQPAGRDDPAARAHQRP
jgi:hypothetical protein